MSDTLPCPSCLPADCGTLVDDDGLLYSLESNLFPFVINCPEGYDCSAPDIIVFNCCVRIIRLVIPHSLTAEQRAALIAGATAQCALLLASCKKGPNPPGDPPPDDPPPFILYYNTPQNATVLCPDGAEFTYSVRAGIAVGTTQEEADNLAIKEAKTLASQHRICLSSLPSYLCIGNATTKTIKATGNFLALSSGSFGADFWQVISGTIPTGMTFNGGFTFTHLATLTGTPTTAGTYTFTVRVTNSLGDHQQREYTIKVVGITNADPFPTATVGTPFSLQLTQAGFSSVEYSVSSGALPDGLELDQETGEISGTPTQADTGAIFTLCASGELA